MVILAVDTACGPCSVALAAPDGTIMGYAEEPQASRQAERLVPMMQDLLAEHRLAYTDLSLLVTTVGPGSFTGLRIGMTAVKGIALVTGLPAMGVSTLEVLAYAAEQDAPFLVLLNAMRGQVYAQQFSSSPELSQTTLGRSPKMLLESASQIRGMTALSEPTLIDVTEIPAWTEGCTAIAGNCSALVTGFTGTLLPDALPHAKDTARLAAARIAAGVIPAPPEPLYIREADAKPPTPVAPL